MKTLKGYRSYILAGLAVVYGVSGYFLGHLDGKTAMDTIWAGLTVFTMRSAIK